MRENISGARYKLKRAERVEYAEIFNTCPYAANVFLMIMELGRGIALDMPERPKDRVEHFEYLIDIRFFNPFIWQI